MKSILGKKIGMTSMYTEENGAQPVTVIECSPSTLTTFRNKEKDGYVAVQLQMEKTKKRNVSREYRVEVLPKDAKIGDVITLDIFSEGERVNVRGVTKGKGFQGVVKRHGFKGAPSSHGHKHDLRKPGSIGSTTPQHVLKGKRMAGRMGRENMMAKNLLIVFIDQEKHLLGVRGAVPGNPGGVVQIFSQSK